MCVWCGDLHVAWRRSISGSPSCARTSLCSQHTFASDTSLLAAHNARCLTCASGLPDAFELDYDALDEFLRRIEAMMCVTLALSLIPHRRSRSAHSHCPSHTSHTTRRATCSCCKHITSLHTLASSAYLACFQTVVYVKSAQRCKPLITRHPRPDTLSPTATSSHDTQALTR